MKYLSDPCSSFEVEILFSTCGIIVNNFRTRLGYEKVGNIVFLKKSLELFDYVL